jgi:hypothetical protein
MLHGALLVARRADSHVLFEFTRDHSSDAVDEVLACYQRVGGSKAVGGGKRLHVTRLRGTSWYAFRSEQNGGPWWGRGPAAALATTLKRAVDLTAWDGKATQT